MRHSVIHELPRYDRYLGGKGGLEIGYPWLTVGAIVALEHYVFQSAPPSRLAGIQQGEG